MTVSSSVRTAGPYTGTGAVSVYPFAFKVFLTSDVLVQLVDTAGILTIGDLGTDYSVSLNSDQDNNPGGNVNLTTPLASGATITIGSQIPLTQGVVLTNPGGFYPLTISNALDKLTILIQQALSSISGALRVPEVAASTQVLPEAAVRANKLLSFDSLGNPITVAPVSGSGTALALLLASTSGTAQIGFNPPLNYAVATLGRHVADEFWNVCDFPWLAVGDDTANDSAAVQACITAAAAAGAGVYIPPRVKFAVNSLSFPNNTHIRGGGQDKSILRQVSGANAIAYVADPGSSSTYTSNIKIEDITLEGRVVADGFQEVLHLLVLQGASDVLCERVKFIGWQGDAAYVGTGNERGQNPTQVRHNRQIKFIDCVFDGVNKNNRNAISIIDCDGAWVERCTFTRCSQQTMPSCIDIEPDSGGTPNGTSSVIRNINIIRNKFRDNAGTATISINIPHALSTYATVPSVINIHGNDLDNSVTYSTATYGIGISINTLGAVDRAISDMGISIQNNTVNKFFQPFLIAKVRGVDIIGNTFSHSAYSAEIGDSTATYNTLDVRVHGNTFYKVAEDNTAGGNGVNVYAGDGIDFSKKNFFDSCGKADNSYNSNITLTTAGTKSNITVKDNTFYSPVSNSNAWPVRHDAGVLSAGTTQEGNNRVINVNGGFVNFAHDYIPINTWQTLALLNSWAAFGSNYQTPQFLKDANGFVRLRGSIKSGTTVSGDTIANFAAGFRAVSKQPFTVYTASGLGSVQVEHTQGDLQVLTLLGNTHVSLNGICWQAEA